jgi:hypothetical protein
MYRACIAIVDATRARLFTFERATEPDAMRDELHEHTDLANPALRAAGIPRRDGLVVDEVPRDLVELRPANIRDQLAAYGSCPRVRRAPPSPAGSTG